MARSVQGFSTELATLGLAQPVDKPASPPVLCHLAQCSWSVTTCAQVGLGQSPEAVPYVFMEEGSRSAVLLQGSMLLSIRERALLYENLLRALCQLFLLSWDQ